MRRNSSAATVTLQVGDLGWASSDAVIDSVLGRRTGVLEVAANAHSGTATVTFDTAVTSVPELAGWVRDCGFHCAGQSVPDHVCDPMAEPEGHAAMDHSSRVGVDHSGHVGHQVREHGSHGAAQTATATTRGGTTPVRGSTRTRPRCWALPRHDRPD